MARKRKLTRKKSRQSKTARRAYRAKKRRSYGARKKKMVAKVSRAIKAPKMERWLEARKPGKPFIKPQAPAVIAKEVTGISGKLKLIPGLIIGILIAAYMLLKRK